jgi:hypothetical protein
MLLLCRGHSEGDSFDTNIPITLAKLKLVSKVEATGHRSGVRQFSFRPETRAIFGLVK